MLPHFTAAFPYGYMPSISIWLNTRKDEIMKTACVNPECNHIYNNISHEAIGKKARCKRCNTVFEIVEYIEPAREEPETQPEITEQEVKVERKRKTVQEIVNEKLDDITVAINKILPLLNASYERKDNENDTRRLIDSILHGALRYEISDIKTEQKIESRRADYILSVKGEPVMVIEAKKIGMTLKENQIFQAAAYGAYAGIKWVVLTNALVWQLYRITTGEKIQHDLIFTIDLLDGLDREEAELFYLISKEGLSRKNLLEQRWEKIRALRPENIINVLLDEDVLSKIRTALIKRTGCKEITKEELKIILEQDVLQL
jgi:predicted type IV restriction endonuclease